MSIRLLAPTLVLLLGVSPLAVADNAADRTALEAAAQSWTRAFNAHNADALVALATEDVVLLDPGLAPVSGRAAAREAWARALRASQSQLTSATKESVIEGPVAWRIGAFTHTLPSGATAATGQSLEIWKRVNGQWKLHRQMSSTLLAQPRLLTVPRPSEPVLDNPGN
jgi:ketosteroid isomerase-like protein